MTRQLIIFDWEHVLARGEHTTPESPFRSPGEKYVWMAEDIPELLTFLHDHEDYELAVATNQGGISFGIIRLDETQGAIFALLKELDFHIPFLVSSYHEKRPHLYRDFWSWRMPNCGMLTALYGLYPDIERENVLVVGDRDEVLLAAQTADFAFYQTEAFLKEIRADLSSFESDEVNAGEDFMPAPTGEVLSPEERAMLDDDEDDDDGYPPF